MTQRFHFTFGPVQGFVAQARRTRDLWAGSWLLSYLAESAIAAAEKAGATMVLPYRADGVRGVVTMQKDAALFGGFPNRFTAEADDPVGAAAAAIAAMRGSWQTVADAVRERYVAPAEAEGSGAREIWDRQVESFWETAWVVGDAGALAARKNLRLVDARVEPGDHCSLMGDLQELSGHYGPGARDGQTRFWDTVRKQASALDLEENERLCAIALIKRLFPHVASKGVGCELEEARGWPSTAWLAASPWIERARTRLPAAAEFALTVKGLAWKSGSTGERDAARVRFGSTGPEDFAALDGPLFFESVLADPGALELEAGADTSEAVRRLRELRTAAGSAPEPFYAVLLMDGDRMGRVLEEARTADPGAGEGRVSRALASFAGGVAGIVSRHHGYTVYAGGDDVLALMPAPGALACAEDLAAAYTRAFEELGLSTPATISGGLVFAHYKAPLRNVLRHAHHLLDAVAKEATGRGALALSVVQSSGTTAEWAAPWEIVNGCHSGVPAPLRELTRHFSEAGSFNASYLYNLRARLAGLFGDSGLDMPAATALPEGLDPGLLEAVAVAEYRRAKHASGGPAPAEPPIDALLALTRRWRRGEDGTVQVDEGAFPFGGIRLARFLARMEQAGATELQPREYA